PAAHLRGRGGRWPRGGRPAGGRPGARAVRRRDRAGRRGGRVRRGRSPPGAQAMTTALLEGVTRDQVWPGAVIDADVPANVPSLDALFPHMTRHWIAWCTE